MCVCNEQCQSRNMQTEHACMLRSAYIESDRRMARQPGKIFDFLADATAELQLHDIIKTAERRMPVSHDSALLMITQK